MPFNGRPMSCIPQPRLTRNVIQIQPHDRMLHSPAYAQMRGRHFTAMLYYALNAERQSWFQCMK